MAIHRGETAEANCSWLQQSQLCDYYDCGPRLKSWSYHGELMGSYMNLIWIAAVAASMEMFWPVKDIVTINAITFLFVVIASDRIKENESLIVLSGSYRVTPLNPPRKMHLKMSFRKWRSFCLGLNVLITRVVGAWRYRWGKHWLRCCQATSQYIRMFTYHQ